MEVWLVVCLLLLGVAVGFAAGLLGIGGDMLLVPFLTILFAGNYEKEVDVDS